MLPIELNILTLNVWGIPFVSSDRTLRIAAIGTELSTGMYDIVSMQEVWSQKDCQTLIQITEATLPYSHYFHSGVMGAGLLVLSKYPIVGTLFHAWSVNGYFHRIQHADWFGGKGVGMCRILIGERIIHLYNAHLHAEYDNENDEYKTHRVIQAFDTAQFIGATRGDAALQVLAGDLNTQPHDITYKMLLYASKMKDCCSSHTIKTSECKHNSYTSKRQSAKNPQGIRIDHIFMRTADSMRATVLEYKLPFPERVPGQKFSFSDHEAVLARVSLSASTTTATAQALNTVDVEETCPAPFMCEPVGDAVTFVNAGYCNDVNAACDKNVVVVNSHEATSATQRLAALNESITLCDTSLEQLKVDRILYYSVAGFLAILLILMVEFAVPRGFKTIYLLLKFLVFGIILFCIFMGSIWNFMERNGILSGKTSMQIMLRNIEKYELL